MPSKLTGAAGARGATAAGCAGADTLAAGPILTTVVDVVSGAAGANVGGMETDADAGPNVGAGSAETRGAGAGAVVNIGAGAFVRRGPPDMMKPDWACRTSEPQSSEKHAASTAELNARPARIGRR